VVCVGAFVLAGTACSKSENKKSSDSNSSTTQASSGGGNSEEFCRLNTELGSAPTNEQLDQIAAVAPDEIAAEVQFIVDDVKRIGAEAQSNPSKEFQAAHRTTSEYITNNCTPSTTQGSQSSPSS
jgi:hypothetical protein